MFLYKGFNPDGNQSKQIEFEDEYEAIDFARENYYRYPQYEIIDLIDNAVIESNKTAQYEQDSINDMMFPEGEDE